MRSKVRTQARLLAKSIKFVNGGSIKFVEGEQFKGIAPCQHEYQRAGTMGGCCIVYRCVKCGDEYEKDVS